MTTQLSRALGLRGASAISTGLAFAALNFLGMGAMLGYGGGDAAWMPVAVAALLMLVVRGVFSELNAQLPTAAGIRLYMARSFDERLALVITLTYMATIVLVIAADAFIIGEAISYVLGQAGWVSVVYVAALLAAATWVNLKGIRLTGRVENAATATVVVAVATFAVVALARSAHPHLLASPVHGQPASHFVQMVVLAIFLFAGFEWVTTNAEEVVRPSIVPRAMLIAIGVLFVSEALFSVAMGHLLTPDQLDSAYPQLHVARHALGEAGVWLMMTVTAITAVNTFNGGFATASRFIYAVAREGKLPAGLSRLNDNAVPTGPVLLLGAGSMVMASIVALTDSFKVMVSVGAALEAGIYAIAAFCVLRLRRRQPGAERAHRLWGGKPVAVGTVALFAVLALVASVSVGDEVNPLPLAVIAAFAVASVVYVVRYLPALERRHAEQLAARRAARKEARQRAGRLPADSTAPQARDAG